MPMIITMFAFTDLKKFYLCTVHHIPIDAWINKTVRCQKPTWAVIEVTLVNLMLWTETESASVRRWRWVTLPPTPMLSASTWQRTGGPIAPRTPTSVHFTNEQQRNSIKLWETLANCRYINEAQRKRNLLLEAIFCRPWLVRRYTAILSAHDHYIVTNKWSLLALIVRLTVEH